MVQRSEGIKRAWRDAKAVTQLPAPLTSRRIAVGNPRWRCRLRSHRAFLGLSNVIAQDGRGAAALNWAQGGMDFADALHLAAGESCEAFASFDRGLQKCARRLDAPVIRGP